MDGLPNFCIVYVSYLSFGFIYFFPFLRAIVDFGYYNSLAKNKLHKKML
jgi:hypothetical protein